LIIKLGQELANIYDKTVFCSNHHLLLEFRKTSKYCMEQTEETKETFLRLQYCETTCSRLVLVVQKNWMI